jgi:glycyl-tRNA synthetase
MASTRVRTPSTRLTVHKTQVKPDEKKHPKFANVSNVTMKLFDRDAQLGTGIVASMTCGDAVAKGTIANETLAYFMARTQLFMLRIGMNSEKLRFRQHLSTEMAHYAADCWDLEILTAYGWVECVGHADRACYDLTVHAKATNTSVEAQKMLDKAVEVLQLTVKPDRKTIGMTFKKDQKAVCSALEALDSDKAAEIEKAHSSGQAYELDGFQIQPGMVLFTRKKKMVQVVKFTPSVIEPSFGVGRILHALLEHSFSVRKEDAQRVVFQFAPVVAPIKCGVYNLQSGSKFPPIVTRVVDLLTQAGISTKADTSGQSVGRRYARADELGVPFGVTVDFDTVEDDTVTLRERDSMTQRRVPIAALPGLLRELCGLDGDVVAWEDALSAYAEVGSSEASGPITLETTSRGVFSRPAALVKK